MGSPGEGISTWDSDVKSGWSYQLMYSGSRMTDMAYVIVADIVILS